MTRALILVLFATVAAAGDDVIPAATRLDHVGRGVAVIFSPDLTVPGNCDFYAALGFTCFAEADWAVVLEGIRKHGGIRTVVLETHGTNGNGLKLQRSYDAAAERSYISVGALQEKLEPAGVHYLILSACNSERLLRSSIYRQLDPHTKDKLFLPATRGIIGASSDWDAARSTVTVLIPQSSQVEMTVVGQIGELGRCTRDQVLAAAPNPPREFAISDLMMQILLRKAQLRSPSGVDEVSLSAKRSAARESETLLSELKRHLETLAVRYPPADARAR
jgi:hypothetical protein